MSKMTRCALCGVGPEDECSMECPSRFPVYQAYEAATEAIDQAAEGLPQAEARELFEQLAAYATAMAEATPGG